MYLPTPGYLSIRDTFICPKCHICVLTNPRIPLYSGHFHLSQMPHLCTYQPQDTSLFGTLSSVPNATFVYLPTPGHLSIRGTVVSGTTVSRLESVPYLDSSVQCNCTDWSKYYYYFSLQLNKLRNLPSLVPMNSLGMRHKSP